MRLELGDRLPLFTGMPTLRARFEESHENPEEDLTDFLKDLGGLYEESESLETTFGEKLAWERLDERRACRVATYPSGSIEQDPQVLEEIRKWMIDRLLKFKKVFDAPLTDLSGG